MLQSEICEKLTFLYKEVKDRSLKKKRNFSYWLKNSELLELNNTSSMFLIMIRYGDIAFFVCDATRNMPSDGNLNFIHLIINFFMFW